MTFDVVRQVAGDPTAIDRLKLVYELNRALGSLIYQNGSKLNDSNLNRLLDNTDGLFTLLRNQVETISNQRELKTSVIADNEIIDRIDLISVQLAYNLTIPTIVSSVPNQEPTNTQSMPITTMYEYFYVEDKFKIRVCASLVRIIRYHRQDRDNGRRPNDRIGDKEEKKMEMLMSRAKVLSKALQGVENLFYSATKHTSSVQASNSTTGGNSQHVNSNWIQSNENELKLADILAIVKVIVQYINFFNFN